MPANRSRTLNWQRCLQQIHERRGSIDIAIDCEYAADENGSHLVWRVRVLALSDEEILVEQPTALGQVIPIEKDISLIAIMTVGQNRWMFSTVNIGLTRRRGTAAREIPALRLRMPTAVRRCQRRGKLVGIVGDGSRVSIHRSSRDPVSNLRFGYGPPDEQ